MTTGEAIALFTLLVTILGWFVTGFYQRRILKTQLESERERDARQLYLPRQYRM